MEERTTEAQNMDRKTEVQWRSVKQKHKRWIVKQTHNGGAYNISPREEHKTETQQMDRQTKAQRPDRKTKTKKADRKTKAPQTDRKIKIAQYGS